MHKAIWGAILLAATGLVGCGEDFVAGSEGGSTAAGGSGGQAGAGGSGGEAGTGGSGGSSPDLISVSVEAVTERGDPIEGADVIVSDVDGGLFAEYETAADGTVQVDLPSDGLVTIAHGYTTTPSGNVQQHQTLRTAMGLADGGTFRQSYPPAPEVAAPNEPMVVVISVGDPCAVPTGVTRYRAALSCNHGGVFVPPDTFTFSEYRGCAGESTYDAYVFALDANDRVIGYADAFDRDFTAGETATWMLCPSNTNLTETSVQLTDVPPGSESFDLRLYGRRGYDTEARFRDRAMRNAPGPTATVALRLPASGFVAYDASFHVALTEPVGPFTAWVERSITGLATQPATLSQSVQEIAIVDSLPDLDLSDVERPLIAWTLSSAGELGDAIILGTAWLPDVDTLTTWELIRSPARTGQAKLPVLPDQLAAYRPAVGDQIGATYLHHAEHDGIDGVAPFFENATDSNDTLRVTAHRVPN